MFLFSKTSECCIFGLQVNVYKQPITDLGKKSKKGRLSLEQQSDGTIVTKEQGTGDPKKVLIFCSIKFCLQFKR